jgi:hypothetical protein
MKIILILFLAYCMNIFPQTKEEYSPKVEEFMNIVEGYWQNLKNLNHPLPADEFLISDEDLDDVLKKMYAAIEDDPIGYTNYLARKYHEWGKEIKEKKLDANKLTTGNIEGLFCRKIEEKYSRKFLTLIKTPYFLRVKVTDKSPGVYTTKEGSSYDKFIVKGKVEEIIKGEKRFDEGDVISFMYLKTTTCFRNYEIGKSYFVPFRVSTLEISNYEGLSLQWFDCTGSYLIENETIKIPENYFEIAEEINWDEFKEQFIDKYIIK